VRSLSAGVSTSLRAVPSSIFSSASLKSPIVTLANDVAAGCQAALEARGFTGAFSLRDSSLQATDAVDERTP
jgi:hypothetical protein